MGRGTQRGQSIVEYLVIAGAIILALLVVKGQVDSKMAGLRDSALGKVDTAKNTVINKVVADRH